MLLISNGVTPLMRAVLNGSYDLVDILLKSGDNPNLKNVKKKTVFSIASDKTDEKILRLLEGLQR